MDYYSRYFEVVILRSTTSTKVINSLQPIFARFGVPHTLKTDNGPQFISEEFKAFLAENGIEHRTTPPLWPQANGEVERQNRTLLKVIQVAQIEGKDWRQELHKFLTAHRSTPQMTTGVAPFFLMFGREMRSKLPELRREAPITNEEIRDRDWARKLTQKDYVDTKRHAVESQVEVGDQVLLRNTKINKLSPNYDPSPCEVIDRNRGEVTLRKKDGVEVKRNVSFVKKYQENGTTESESVVPLQPIANPLESATPLQPITSQPIASQPIASQPIASQPVASPISVQQTVNPSSPMLKESPRPTRTIRLPKRFDDYELSKA